MEEANWCLPLYLIAVVATVLLIIVTPKADVEIGLLCGMTIFLSVVLALGIWYTSQSGQGGLSWGLLLLGIFILIGAVLLAYA